MRAWKTLSRETILSHSKFLTVENHVVELPDGHIIPDWPWVITPDYVNVVAETTQEQFLCFRQTKYSVKGTSLAPVGGYMEPGEDPLKAAQRELLEETGYTAPEWIRLGTFSADANRGVATGYLFLARGAYPVRDPDTDDLEEQHLLYLSRDDLASALAGGEFKVLAWATVVALALLSLDRS